MPFAKRKKNAFLARRFSLANPKGTAAFSPGLQGTSYPGLSDSIPSGLTDNSSSVLLNRRLSFLGTQRRTKSIKRKLLHGGKSAVSICRQ
jgi:hypothetical protein